MCARLCVLVIFSTSLKNVELLKFQLSRAGGLVSHGKMSHDLIGKLVQNIICFDHVLMEALNVCTINKNAVVD